MRRFYLMVSLMLVIVFVGCGGGGGGSGDSHIPMGTLSVNVKDAADDTPVNDASIAVYDGSNILVTRGLTVDGNFDYSLSPETYTIRVAAQDYLPVPTVNQSAVPFEITDGQTTTQNIALDAHPDAGTLGQIVGYVYTQASALTGVSGVLVVAKDTDLAASSTTGPDGAYVIYNVEPGSYTLEVYLAGYREKSSPVTVVVAAASSYDADDIEIEVHDNADLSGKVNFLAGENSVIDITLIHPDTLDTIPGLSTYNDASTLTYALSSVPPGTYIAWASFQNDDYVMDPDSIRKHDLPKVTFTTSSGDLVQDFDVTGAVKITSITNESNLVVPVEVTDATPTFTWEKGSAYASVKEYIIEVFNSRSETIWGGFDDNGVIKHPQIGASATSVDFDFDGSATALEDGEVYQWKIYADNSADPNVQGLLSSSEDQMGLFTYIQN